MSDLAKINTSHLSRLAYVYLRQSSAAQVEHNRESTARQYALVAKAAELGWPPQQVLVIDEDLGVSGSGIVERSGFARLIAEVALGHVGIVLGLEVSRLARNNADWYRLLDLCGLTDTLIGDADGIYHPALFNDRLVLGLKGTMSEAESHVLRARLLGGIRNKAARGELRRSLPVGFVWGEHDGEVRFHPDDAVCSAIRTVFARFAELGSARRVWLWFRSEHLSFPLQSHDGSTIRWIDPGYITIHHVMENPVYAGAYAYGKSRCEVTLDASGARKKRIRKLPQSQWSVFIPHHHEGYIDWNTYEANRARMAANTRPRPHQTRGGAVREGTALLQGLAVCGQCGRKLRTHYTGRTASAGYHCPGKTIANGRGVYCLSIGATQVMRRLRARCSPRSRRLVLKRLLQPQSASKPIMMARSHNGVWQSSARVTRRNAPSGAIVLSTPTTVLLRVGSKPSGRTACAHSTRPRPSSRSGRHCGRERSVRRSVPSCLHSAPTCSQFGRRQPPRHATRRNCCAR